MARTETQSLEARQPARKAKGERRGSAEAGFPALRMPTPEIADRGVVRLGCAIISGCFPLHS